MTAPRPVPADFGARLRAARAYADDISREEFAERLNLSGASASNIRVWETGRRQPSPLTAESLIPRLAEASGLGESFFWGQPSSDGTLEALRQRVEDLHALIEGLAVSGLLEQIRVLLQEERQGRPPSAAAGQ